MVKGEEGIPKLGARGHQHEGTAVEGHNLDWGVVPPGEQGKWGGPPWGKGGAGQWGARDYGGRGCSPQG